jgi:phage shock protein PspC (stress-responsive transcriptional regulator)
MRKVITVNLNGNAYQLEEAGFEALHAYLAAAEARLAGNPDQAEILKDLEQAIADKCNAVLGPRRNVVSVDDIQTILAQMGPVDTGTSGDASAAGGTPGAGDAASAATGTPPRRKLYRLPGESMLLGVCAGFAAYFNIEVVWIRIAAIVLAIGSSGVIFLIYLLMVFVMPRASTPEMVAEAHGAAANAREVMDRVKKKFGVTAPG